MTSLYTHQQVAVEDCLRSLRPDNPTLLVAPTGAGKTMMAAEIALHFKRVLVVAHRIEIIDQARAEFGKHVQVMSIQAALKYGPPDVNLLIIDEAHRSTAGTYRQVIEKYRGCAVLGLTATPRRTDGKGLVDVFDEIVECANTAELIAGGFLVPFRAFEAPEWALELREKLAGMRRDKGDYAQKEADQALNRPRLIGQIVREYKKRGIGRRAICFAVSVKHSVALCDAFVRAGVRAVHLDGKSAPRLRRETLESLAQGKVDVVCSVNLFTEGWDCPAVSCVIMARPTCSLTLYLQSVGRGMRPDPSSGKADLLILDHAGNIDKHGPPDMIREWSLESEEQKAKRLAEVNELERRLALGFDSIEAELEERKRIFDETYSCEEVRRILSSSGANFTLSNLPVFVSSRGYKRKPRKGPWARYPRVFIDQIAASITQSFTPQEVCKVLNIGRPAALSKFLRKRKIYRLKDWPVSNPRYPKKEVLSLKECLSHSYSPQECRIALGTSQKLTNKLLRLAGIEKSVGDFYSKAAVDSLAVQRAEFQQSIYTPRECVVLLGSLQNNVATRLKERGVSKHSCFDLKGYLKSEVDRIASGRS